MAADAVPVFFLNQHTAAHCCPGPTFSLYVYTAISMVPPIYSIVDVEFYGSFLTVPFKMKDVVIVSAVRTPIGKKLSNGFTSFY